MHICEYIRSEGERVGRRLRLGFLGLGVSNTALLRLLSNTDAEITLRADKQIDKDIIAKFPECRIFEGERALEEIEEDVLFLSPSVRRDAPELAAAAKRGCIFTSDAELFLSGARGTHAVTGSDGKSTTATIAARILERKFDTGLGGNIGTPLCTLGEREKYVVELSSFQAMYITEPTERAVLTSLTPNHLNWHLSEKEYCEAKLRLIRRAAYSAVSLDSELCREALSSFSPDTVYSIKYDYESLAREFRARDYITTDGSAIYRNGEYLAAIGTRGLYWYNLANLLGAASLTLGEVEGRDIEAVAADMPKLRHRLELIHTHASIDFFNSSIDTTPERTQATLVALNRPVSIILGGRGKGLSILPVLPTLLKYAERISLYGEAGAEFYRDIMRSGLLCAAPCRLFERFDEAAEFAAEGGTERVAVLLSPMATGYGEFRDYAERGEHFIKLIKEKYNSRHLQGRGASHRVN